VKRDDRHDRKGGKKSVFATKRGKKKGKKEKKRKE